MTSSGFIRRRSRSRAADTAGRKGPETAPATGPLLGRELFGRISAIEGIRLDEETREVFAEFDRKGLSAEERRREIIARFRREAAE